MTDEDAGRGEDDAGRSGSRERAAHASDARESESAGEHSAPESATRASERERANARALREDRDGGGLDLSLPPILLPDVRLPERIRLVFPVPDPPEKVSRPTRIRVSWVIVAVALADALDALTVAFAGPKTLAWVRAVAGVLLSVVLVGGPGLLYAWELLAILGGVGVLSVAPTLTLLVLARILVSE
ncbi:hypothetical protein [Halorussus caseinilyticus]|uniref:Uncharacterized protein n=1 Tax=Halorussus caseinilyticus TaxID=3034025 RepID=A0ABD5WRG7_9EURY|nr:hypothetical protein [Halorussus sp. DT72]